jgi:hypothetical protein
MEIAIEVALAGGILVSAGFLVWGLAFRSPAALQWGLIILMLTPVARVVIMTAGLFQQRDLVFGPVSLVILAVLFSSLYTAVQIAGARRTSAPDAAPVQTPSP